MNKKLLFSSLVSVGSLLLLYGPVKAEMRVELSQQYSSSEVSLENKARSRITPKHRCLNNPKPECGNPVRSERSSQADIHLSQRKPENRITQNHICLNNPKPECNARS